MENNDRPANANKGGFAVHEWARPGDYVAFNIG